MASFDPDRRLTALRRATVLLLVLPTIILRSPNQQAAFAAGSVLWYPRISVVWPHDAQGRYTAVVGASAVNVAVWPTVSVQCSQHPGTSLWVAKNNEPATPVPVEGHLQFHSHGAGSFPSLEFNDVPANLAADPQARYTFIAGNEVPVSNVWVHAADPRTFFPHVAEPVGSGVPQPGQLDTRIQIVFPHNASGRAAPVGQATYVNVAADIFLHGTLQSVPTDFEPDALDIEEA